MKRFDNMPRFGRFILNSIANRDEIDAILGDFEEEYNDLKKSRGSLYAHYWYWKLLLISLPSFLSALVTWSCVMLNNYFKVACRNIKRYKVNTFVNVLGLSVGIVCFMLILNYMKFELSYENFHKNLDSLYRIVMIDLEKNDYQSKSVATWPALANALENDVSGITKAAKVKKEECVIIYNDVSFKESGVYYVEQDFMEMFSFSLTRGDRNTALQQPNSILLTHEMAEKYFGNEDPVGKMVEVATWPYTKLSDYTVTGVLNTIPSNTQFKFDFLVSYNSYYSLYRGGKAHIEEAWQYWDPSVYVMLNKEKEKVVYENEINMALLKYKDAPVLSKYKLALQPVRSIHLGGNYRNDYETHSSITYLYMLSAIVLIIMAMASFNYMNLSAAQSTVRSMEIGIRKVIGAERKQLVKQFLAESVLISFIALVFAFIAFILIMPYFSNFMEKDILSDMSEDFSLLIIVVCITALIGLVSGSYPAFFLSSLRPISTMTGTFSKKSKTVSFTRNGLVVFQYIVTVILIVSAFVIHDQMNYISDKNLGYQKDQIITIHSMDKNLNRNYEPFLEKLRNNGNIINASAGLDIPTTIRRTSSVGLPGRSNGEKIKTYYTFAGFDFLSMYEIEFVQGRDFSRKHQSDSENALILNETAVKELELKNPLGQYVSFQHKEWKVIGVVKDFNFRSLYEDVSPLTVVMHHRKSAVEYFSVKINGTDISKTLSEIETVYKEFSPDFPFAYSFLDERIDVIYKSDRKMGDSIRYFTVLAVLISCLGLFGLVSFSVEQKRKEISVRKVLGASVVKIVGLLSKEYIRLVLVANIIAWPVAWYIMDTWLRNFAYRIDIGISTFLLSGFSVVITAFAAISFRSLKAAKTNPVDSLKCD